MAGAAPSFGYLFRNTELLSYTTGHRIFSEGDPGDQMYAVQEGEVDLLVGDIVVETVGPGGVFGEMALIEQEPRSATAIARSDTKLAAIDERRFNFLTQNTPMFALNVMKLMAHRLRRMDRAEPDVILR